MTDILGQAIYDHHHQNGKNKLWISNRYGPREEMPIETYFRGEDDMPDLEWVALNECWGRVLDIGAGAGSHALELQTRDYDVTALEISPLAVQIMKDRGVKKVIEADIFLYDADKFDTLLLLMNGIGLTGTLDGLSAFLQHARTLLSPGGQLLFDSSDVAYLYDDVEKPADAYYGEIWYRYEYKKQATEWFRWLYIDEKTLATIAKQQGWAAEVIYEDEYGQYLARLTPST